MDNSILDFLVRAARLLALEESPPAGLEEGLVTLEDTLTALIERYQQPAPAGAESIREAMLESLDLYLSAIDCLRTFLEEPKGSYLSKAISLAEEASDLLDQVDYIAEESQQWISQFQEC